MYLIYVYLSTKNICKNRQLLNIQLCPQNTLQTGPGVVSVLIRCPDKHRNCEKMVLGFDGSQTETSRVWLVLATQKWLKLVIIIWKGEHAGPPNEGLT